MTKVTSFTMEADGYDGSVSFNVSLTRPPSGTKIHLGHTPDVADVPADVREVLRAWLDGASA